MDKIIEQCYEKSIALLIKNSTKEGFLAATPGKRASNPSVHYNWIFGRDASVCSLGAIATGDKKLIKLSKATLTTLAQNQSKLGQIPNALSGKKKQTEYYFMASVDGTLWWLIALIFYNEYSGDKKLMPRMRNKVKRAITWLLYQTGGETNLIEQAEASDWADLMPRSGHVLYSNVLWYAVQELYNIKEASITRNGIESIFSPFLPLKNKKFLRDNFLYKRLREDIRTKIRPVDYLLSYIQAFSFGRHCDVFGNSLAILFNLTEKKQIDKIIKYIIDNGANKFYPVQVMFPPIEKNEEEWDEMMLRKNRNRPYHYHNGGIWPFAGGFWVMALHKAGKAKLAKKELAKLAQANKENKWEFNEWLHGQTGEPLGMPGQSWNAGSFLLAYHYLKGDIKLCKIKKLKF